MTYDIPTVIAVLTVITLVMGILGSIFGWFKIINNWWSSMLASKQRGTLAVPKQTMILIPLASSNALRWSMGTQDGQPCMQIVGDLHLTNIFEHSVYVRGVKLKKPRASGYVTVKAQASRLHSQDHATPSGRVTQLRFVIMVQPPVLGKGEVFKGNIAITDQFGNDHWIKNLKFPYL
jgi:hypothetical protein